MYLFSGAVFSRRPQAGCHALERRIEAHFAIEICLPIGFEAAGGNLPTDRVYSPYLYAYGMKPACSPVDSRRQSAFRASRSSRRDSHRWPAQFDIRWRKTGQSAGPRDRGLQWEVIFSFGWISSGGRAPLPGQCLGGSQAWIAAASALAPS